MRTPDPPAAPRRSPSCNTNDIHSTIGSLCCSEADEAKTLIPSLTDKISNDDLTELLEEIAKLQSA